MRKKARKKVAHHKRSPQSLTWYFVPLVSIIIGSITLLLVIKTVAEAMQKNGVLGMTTYLAKGGDSGGGSSSGSGGDSKSESKSEEKKDSSGTENKMENRTGTKEKGSDSGSSIRQSPTSDVKTQTRTDTGVRTQTETKLNETRTEVRLSESERIRTRVKNGETRIDITSGGIKTRLEYKDGKVIVKAKQEDGTEIELEDGALPKVEDRLAASGIKIEPEAETKNFVFQKGTTKAVTKFPISVDLATNMLTITTPAGQKNVTVLPDQAVQNLIAANVISRIGGQAVVDAVRNKTVTSVSDVITLGIQNNVPVYEINGISNQRLLGLIPVTVQKSVAVSAETGTLVSTQETFINRLLDAVSF